MTRVCDEPPMDGSPPGLAAATRNLSGPRKALARLTADRTRLPRELLAALPPQELSAALPWELSAALPWELSAALPWELSAALPWELSAALPWELSAALPWELSTALPWELSTALPWELSAALPRLAWKALTRLPWVDPAAAALASALESVLKSLDCTTKLLVSFVLFPITRPHKLRSTR